MAAQNIMVNTTHKVYSSKGEAAQVLYSYVVVFLVFSIRVLRCLLGTSRVLGRGRLVAGLERRPLLNQLVMACRSYVKPSLGERRKEEKREVRETKREKGGRRKMEGERGIRRKDD